jgi:aminodeoxyfutalosine deaminase
MVKKYSVDVVHPISSEAIEGGVLVLDEKGKVLDLLESKYRDQADVVKLKGHLVPGLINTHCHLELSHMKGKVDTGTSLIPFIRSVVTKRNLPQAVIDAAIKKANAQMYRNGIVAVGDISNQIDSFAVKKTSPIVYYTFVELFDFLQEHTSEKAFADWKSVLDVAPITGNHRASMVPHAPYSVSPPLFARINQQNPKSGITVSIHNQETADEEALFRDKSGGFPEFYGAFGISLDPFTPPGSASIYYAMSHLNAKNRTLFVHNTLTTSEQIKAAHQWSKQVFWATCPNANLYIENRLPNYQAFIDTKARMTIGTDSLTSNWQLCVLEEMKTIRRYQSFVPTSTLLRWATLNGAQALGFDDRLGSFEQGKVPGLNLITGLVGGELGERSRVRRLG